jgi:hypothetical protein
VKRLITAAISLLVVASYAWYATKGTWDAGNGAEERYFPGRTAYQALADSLLAGRLDIPVPLPKEYSAIKSRHENPSNIDLLKPENGYFMFDLSFYKGRYYLYFGPAAAALLYAPYKAVFGSLPTDTFAVILLASGTYLWAALIISEAYGNKYEKLGAAALACGLLAAGFGTAAPWFVGRPAMYEVAISGGTFFMMGGLYMLSRWANRGGGALSIAGLFFGLAFLSRPTQIGAIAMTVPLTLAFRRGKAGLSLRRLSTFCAPIILCMMLSAAYNHLRFENTAEFGLHYQINNLEADKLNPSTLNIPPNIYLYILRTPRIDTAFPYVHANPYYRLPEGLPGMLRYGGFHYFEDAFGLEYISPYMLILFAAVPALFASLRRRLKSGSLSPDGPAAFTQLGLGLCLLGAVSVLWLFPTATIRYIYDYSEYAMTLSALLWFAAVEYIRANSKPGTLKIAYALMITATALTVTSNILLGFRHNINDYTI